MTVKDLPGEDENKKALLAFGQRHFLTSNAFMPERGTAIGRTTMFTVYSFDYSVIEPLDLRISVLGFIPVLGLKSGFRITENLRFAVNTDVIILPIQGNTFVAGYAHSLITFGDIDNNITAGSLFVFTNEAFYPNPCLTFAGNLRLGKNVWLVSDNCLIPLQQFSYSPNPDYLGIYSLGIRYNGNWSSYDGGLFIIPQIFEELPVPIPLISYSVIF